jgi:hypothetical protein
MRSFSTNVVARRVSSHDTTAATRSTRPIHGPGSRLTVTSTALSGVDSSNHPDTLAVTAPSIFQRETARSSQEATPSELEP